MNTCVQAGPLTINIMADMVSPSVSILYTPIVLTVAKLVETACLHPFSISINGHSLSAINPKSILIGDKATLIAA
jgi:hypothetical protein